MPQGLQGDDEVDLVVHVQIETRALGGAQHSLQNDLVIDGDDNICPGRNRCVVTEREISCDPLISACEVGAHPLCACRAVACVYRVRGRACYCLTADHCGSMLGCGVQQVGQWPSGNGILGASRYRRRGGTEPGGCASAWPGRLRDLVRRSGDGGGSIGLLAGSGGFGRVPAGVRYARKLGL